VELGHRPPQNHHPGRVPPISYVIIDEYSRYVVGWHVATGEDSTLTREVIDDAITRNGVRPEILRADRGSSMTSKPVAELLADLGVALSYSRPRDRATTRTPKRSSRP
jgi:transposase InsO family protein